MSLRSAIEWLFDPYLDRAGASLNPWWGCERWSPACQNCLGPETLVLYADMTWRPIGNVRVGDELVAFTETPGFGQNRLFERTVVEAVRRTVQPTVELTVGQRTIVASADHRWLVDRGRRYWQTTESLSLGTPLRTVGHPVARPDLSSEDYRAGYVAGATAGDGTMRWNPDWRSASLGYPQCYWRVAVLADDRAILDRLVEYLHGFGVDVEVKPFDGGPTCRRQMLRVETRRRDNLATITEVLRERGGAEWRAGWLAGLFDTDGSYHRNGHNTWLRINQATSNQHILDTAARYAADLGMPFKAETHKGKPGMRLCGRVDAHIAFLTRIAPALARKCEAFFGQRLSGTSVEVTGLCRGPARELVDIQTSSRTFVAEGLGTHNCYIFRQPPLRMRHMRFSKAGIGGKTPIVFAPRSVLFGPLRWRIPHMIFVESLGDLWHGEVNIVRTAEVFAIMALTPRHIYLTLTKRTRRMHNWLRSARFARLVREAVVRLVDEYQGRIAPVDVAAALAHLDRTGPVAPMSPWPNVWIGTTVEANEQAAERIPLLVNTPAALRWLSCEPLTNELDDPLDLAPWLGGESDLAPAIGWVVLGGESGPPAKATALDTEPAVGLRPISVPNLIRLAEQAAAAGARVFVKQLGEPWAREVGAASAAGRDMAEWPAPLRVREYPAQLAERALRFDPDNQRALADLSAFGPMSSIPDLDSSPPLAIPAGR